MDSRITFSVIHGWLAFGGPAMLTKMTEEDWVLVLEVFHACRSRRGDKGRDDRKFFEALHYFTVHNITWRALPAEFGSWNSIWKRFWRLSRSGVFETFFEALEKALKGAGGGVPSEVKAAVEQAVTGLKDAMHGDDATRIRQATQRLAEASARIGQATQQATGHGSGSAGGADQSVII